MDLSNVASVPPKAVRADVCRPPPGFIYSTPKGNHMSVVRLLLLAALTRVFATQGVAPAEAVPPENIVPDVVIVNASGCPPVPAEVVGVADGTGFRVIYRE